MSAAVGAGARGNPAKGSGVTGDRHELEAVAAHEAVQELDGGATGDMPILGSLQFPGPVAQAFFESDASVVGIQGPVGSGKTTTLMHSRIRRARMAPRSVIDGVRRYKLGVTRETYRALWSTTIPSYLETVPKALGTWAGGRGDPVTHTVEFEDEFGPIHWVAEFLAFGDDIVASMRGLQFSDLWVNEADTNPVEVLTVGMGRIDRHPARSHLRGYSPARASWGQIACDFNAPSEDNWVFGVFHDEAARERMAREMNSLLPEGARQVEIAFFRQPGAREPGAENLQNLSAGYYATQIAAMTLAGRGDMVARLVDNEVVDLRAGDPVFRREFNPRIHVSAEPLRADPELPLLIGLDQGFTPAAVVAQFRPPMHWRVLAELMFPSDHLMARAFGERLTDLLDRRFPGLRVEAAWGDMAGEAGAAQAGAETDTWNRIVSRVCGFPVRPQRFGSNRVNPRLEAIRAPLEHLDQGEPGLLIDPSCRYLRSGFAARYVWGEEVDRTGNKRKTPDKSKVEANVMDALGYLLLSRSRGDGTSHGLKAMLHAEARRGRDVTELRGLQTGWSISDPYGSGGGL